jgi:hypothetical protein
VHPAYPVTLHNADEQMKRHTYKVIDEMLKDGLLVREKRQLTSDMRARDYPDGIWVTQAGEDYLEGEK